MISLKINSMKKPYKSTEIFSSNLIDNNIINQVNKFHQSLPSSQNTPVVELPSLANKLHLKNILLKDESKRFDLKAFKVLGASFAMAKILHQTLIEKQLLTATEKKELTFNLIKKYQSHFKDIIFVTATDGNHGRAVAWSAKIMGCQAVVYLPESASKGRVQAIKKYGAKTELLKVNCNYSPPTSLIFPVRAI